MDWPVSTGPGEREAPLLERRGARATVRTEGKAAPVARAEAAVREVPPAARPEVAVEVERPVGSAEAAVVRVLGVDIRLQSSSKTPARLSRTASSRRSAQERVARAVMVARVEMRPRAAKEESH